jgi:hypothetical protein
MDTTSSSLTNVKHEGYNMANANTVSKTQEEQAASVDVFGRESLIVNQYKSDGLDNEIIGCKSTISLLRDLSKGVERLKNDLFVLVLKRPEQQETIKVERRKKSGFREEEGNNFESTLRADLHRTKFDENAVLDAPLINQRHAFLEMCQYRHYQFDSLRRAKYSSMMIIFHLNSENSSLLLQPTCSLCSKPMFHVRWHCGEGCVNYDTCQSCYESSSHHHIDNHSLTPYRISYMGKQSL